MPSFIGVVKKIKMSLTECERCGFKTITPTKIWGVTRAYVVCMGCYIGFAKVSTPENSLEEADRFMQIPVKR